MRVISTRLRSSRRAESCLNPSRRAQLSGLSGLSQFIEGSSPRSRDPLAPWVAGNQVGGFQMSLIRPITPAPLRPQEALKKHRHEEGYPDEPAIRESDPGHGKCSRSDQQVAALRGVEEPHGE